MKQYARIFGYFGAYKGKISLYILFTLLSIVFSLVSIAMLMPFLQLIFLGSNAGISKSNNAIISAINDFLLGSIKKRGNVNTLGFICMLMIVFILLKNLFLYLSYYVLNPLKHKVINKLREELYDKVLQLPIGYFTEKRKGDLMSRMTNDVSEVEGSLVGAMEGWIRDPLMIIATLIFLFFLSPQLTLFILILIPLLGLVIGRVTRSMKKHSNEVAIKFGETLSVLDETLVGLRVIKAFTIEKLLRNRFLSANNKLLESRNKIAYRRDLASPLSEVMGVILFTVVLYYGGRLVLKGQLLEASVFMGFLGIFYNIINPAKTLSTSFSNMRKGSAAILRIEEILNAKNTVDDNPNGKNLAHFNNNIEFRNVRFAYDDAVILDDVDLLIEKGKTIALVGSSGAGKSTLADLVPRFHANTLSRDQW